MDAQGKADYLYTYFKWHILLAAAALVILGNVVHRQVTKKDTVLYMGLVNVSVGTDLKSIWRKVFLKIRTW